MAEHRQTFKAQYLSKARRIVEDADKNKDILVRHLPVELLDTIVTYLDLRDIHALVKTGHRRLADAVTGSMFYRKRMDLEDVPHFLIDQPRSLARVPNMDTLCIDWNQADHVDLSHTLVTTLILRVCRFERLSLPPTLKHIYAEEVWVRDPIDMSACNMQSINIKTFHGQIILPDQTGDLRFFKLSRFYNSTSIRYVSEFLASHAFPSLEFLELYDDLTRQPDVITMPDLSHMPRLNTLCCTSNLIHQDAVVPQVKHLIIIFESTFEYAFFPNLTTMTAVFYQKMEPIPLPPLLKTLVLMGHYVVPRYWHPENVPFDNLIVHFRYPNLEDDLEDFLEENENATEEDFLDYPIPNARFFRISEVSDGAYILFDSYRNPELSRFQVEPDHHYVDLVTRLMDLDPERYDLSMLQASCDEDPFDRVETLSKVKYWSNGVGVKP